MKFTFRFICAVLFVMAVLSAAPVDAAEFPFLTGPYPSKGIIEYQLDCGDFLRGHPEATGWTLTVERNGKRIVSEPHPLTDGGRAHGYVTVGDMPNGATYLIHAIITDADQKELIHYSDTFIRRVMPFENATATGLSDIIVPPFTAPRINGDAASCWGRTYQHGTSGLLTQITAADKPLLARPMSFIARTGGGEAAALTGDAPKLSAVGKGKIAYEQTFTGQGLTLHVSGDFDYDGFYLFTVLVSPSQGPVTLNDLHLEIPYRGDVAQLIEASVTWRRIEGTQPQCMGELEKKQGVLWDSKTYPSRNWPRIGNMPPFVWVGDDERGLVYSCASEQGMHNDENLPAAQLERKGDQVVYTAWFVNSPLQLTQERTFRFALQASPFKAMPERARLWRTQPYRMPYKDGTSFTNWFTDGSYPTYGRFLTLPLLKKYAKATGADQVGTMASAVSECGGTPEYLQFWHEWGADLLWPKIKRGEPEQWAVKMMQEAHLPVNPYIRVESASNVSDTNIAYRLWWFNQEIRHAGISYIYQDNPPYVYYDDPPNGYGYVRDDGRRESTSAIWNSRLFAKRIATTAVEAGKTDSPYLWLNAISPVIPGRSFARRMLNGEYLYTKLFTLGQFRVMASKQWGMELDWYPFPQTEESAYPNLGPVRKYWREVFSRLLLHDVTSFSGGDNTGFCERWINALDVFWLDDPTVRWHPYYRNDTQPIAANKTTYISTYTADGRALLFVSSQADHDVIETVQPGKLGSFGAGDLKYFYNAETGERIETGEDGSLKFFIPAMDYRVVIGFRQPWPFAAATVLGMPDLPAQSTLDPERTLTAISRRLLTSRTFERISGSYQLYEQWMSKVVADLNSDGDSVAYFDAQACSVVDFGQPDIQCSVFFDKKRNALLVNYYNAGDHDVNLAPAVRDHLAKLVGKTGHNFIIHPVYGYSEWEFIDIPAKQGLMEIYYSDTPDFWGPHHGPFNPGNMLEMLRHAVDANQRQLGGRPIQ